MNNRFEYKGHIYETVDKCVNLRIENGWTKGVIYKREGQPELYVRSAKEFFEKFKRLTNG